MADKWKKRDHSQTLLALLYIAHVLPLACSSEAIMGYIFHTKDRGWRRYGSQNFHANFSLNGWNDHIIQPARDAVLDYYKVCTQCLTFAVLALTGLQLKFIYYLNQRYAEPPDLEEYMRVSNLS